MKLQGLDVRIKSINWNIEFKLKTNFKINDWCNLMNSSKNEYWNNKILIHIAFPLAFSIFQKKTLQ